MKKMMNENGDKNTIRKKMLEMRNELLKEQVEAYSFTISNLVINSKLYKKSRNICVYQAFRNEVSCSNVIKQAFDDKKNVYVPVTNIDSKTMDFYQIYPDTIWSEGNYGIMEPVINPNTPILQQPALILIPGLVFDRNKHRIGYGGGYYDKYLELHPIHSTIALCYSFQVIDGNLPYEEHDKLPDYIVTEKEII